METIILKKGEYLNVYSAKILSILNVHKKILIDSNPGSGKTSMFVELAIKIKKENKNCRLVFCAPFLIIQSQFASTLKNKGFDIDLSLNYNSIRKKLDPTDKIITSTYQSLIHIINDLTENDIIVLDEAHIFSTSFLQKDNNRTYFNKEASIIFNTKSKVVLMSGTANKYINKLLGVTTIKIKREVETEAIINIFNSAESPIKIAEIFANSTSKDSLNIIYINSTAQCENIKNRLEKIGYKAIVLTSHHKKEEEYIKLVKDSIIDKTIQFLICTSVISTGANIKNDNIGKALMINESNPQEIKQFSKRFREKLDIEVDVILNTTKTITSTSEITTDDKMNLVISEMKKIYTGITQIQASNIPLHYNYTYDKSSIGTKEALIQQLIDRYLIQLSYLNHLRTNKCLDINILFEELELYNDIKPYNKAKKTIELERHKVLGQNAYSKLLTAISEAFIRNKEAFVYEIINGNTIDYYYKNQLSQLTYNEITPKQGDVKEWVENPYFEKKILAPILDIYPYIKSLSKSIYLALNLSPRELNKLKLKLFVNSFIQNHLELVKSLNGNLLKVKDNIIQNQTDEALTSLIKMIFNKCLLVDSIPIADLKTYLDANFQYKDKLKTDEIPLKLIITNDTLFNKENLKSVLEAIFYCNPKPNKKVQSDGAEKLSVIFNENIPENIKTHNNSNFVDLKLIKHMAFNKHGSHFGVPEVFKIIPNPSLLVYQYLKEDYFKLV